MHASWFWILILIYFSSCVFFCIAPMSYRPFMLAAFVLKLSIVTLEILCMRVKVCVFYFYFIFFLLRENSEFRLSIKNCLRVFALIWVSISIVHAFGNQKENKVWNKVSKCDHYRSLLLLFSLQKFIMTNRNMSYSYIDYE
jgi:hypothetical protein